LTHSYYVRQCDTVKEAEARVKELHVAKKLRCVVFDMRNYPGASSDISHYSAGECMRQLTLSESAFGKKFVWIAIQQPACVGRFCMITYLAQRSGPPLSH
jgi:hypothetical protein